MNSHELARRLLELPDLPIATEAMNHVYCSGKDRESHGKLLIATLETYAGRHILIGHPHKRLLNEPNWWISDVHGGEKLPDVGSHWDGRGWVFPKAYPGPTLSKEERDAERVRDGYGELSTIWLWKDGIDRYNSGDVSGIWCQVDARGGEPEPQFGGRWCGSAWDGRCHHKIVDTGRTFETFDEALAALNERLRVYGRVAKRPQRQEGEA